MPFLPLETGLLCVSWQTNPSCRGSVSVCTWEVFRLFCYPRGCATALPAAHVEQGLHSLQREELE